MLFRIWQHALMDQPMSVQELWHWVHICYGDELGLTSDDEDYVAPSLVDDKVSSRLISETFLEESTQGLRKREDSKEMPAELLPNSAPRSHLPSDSSDSSETDEDKNQSSTGSKPYVTPLTCPDKHEGKKMLNDVFPLGVDDLFTLIFTYNKFNMDLMESMKYTDVNISNWEENPSTGLKMRVSHLVVPTSQSVGPKTCQVTETQVLQACSKPGELYVIDVEANNAGVPYSDSFYITTHFCLTRVSASEATCTVHCQIKYRKSVWGLVKSFIEKNVWAGLDDFYKNLGKALEEECIRKQSESGEEVIISQKRESTKVATPAPLPKPVSMSVPSTVISTTPCSNDMALWAILGVLLVLLFFNAVLYYKLSVLEDFDKESSLSPTIYTHIFGKEHTHEQWMSLLQKQTIQHQKEIQQWKTTLQSVVSLLRQAEESITNLQNNIQSVVSEKVVTAFNPPSDSDDLAFTNKHTEL